MLPWSSEAFGSFSTDGATDFTFCFRGLSQDKMTPEGISTGLNSQKEKKCLILAISMVLYTQTENNNQRLKWLFS